MTTGTTPQVLSGYIGRIERLAEEKQAIADDIKDVYAEAEGEGFDKKALRAVISRRKKDRAELESFDAVVETYESNILGLNP